MRGTLLTERANLDHNYHGPENYYWTQYGATVMTRACCDESVLQLEVCWAYWEVIFILVTTQLRPC
eukprot:1142244-Pelagomonas_calceolata.AAC.2